MKAQAPSARDNRFGHPTSLKDRMAFSGGRCCGPQVHRTQGEGRTSKGPSLRDCWVQDEPGRDSLPTERDYLPPTEAPAWSIKFTSVRIRIDLPSVQRRHNSVDWCLRQNHLRQDSGKRAKTHTQNFICIAKSFIYFFIYTVIQKMCGEYQTCKYQLCREFKDYWARGMHKTQQRNVTSAISLGWTKCPKSLWQDESLVFPGDKDHGNRRLSKPLQTA